MNVELIVLTQLKNGKPLFTVLDTAVVFAGEESRGLFVKAKNNMFAVANKLWGSGNWEKIPDRSLLGYHLVVKNPGKNDSVEGDSISVMPHVLHTLVETGELTFMRSSIYGKAGV